MHIYINARFLSQNITGVQRYAVEISRQLKTLHKDISLLAPNEILHKELSMELGVYALGKRSGHLWEQMELSRYLKKLGSPLLLNLANTAPAYYRDQIVTIHDLAFLRNPGWFSRAFYYYYRFLIPQIAKNALKIVTVSNFSKKEIVELLKVPEEKVEVIYNAVSERFLAVSEKTIDYKHGEYILAVSSINPRKNFKNLISAFGRLKLSGVKLVIAGERKNIFADKELNNLIGENKNIIFYGYASDEDLISLYKNAKLFIYPSLYEGFGLSPLEAMACGCPVVVSNTTSLPEVCGDAAYYVDPFTVDSIAEGLNAVLTDEALRQGLIQKGLERVKLFSWEKSAKEHIKVFEEVLNT
ncbi:MAG: glycosyltransferase family 4 protein [Nitrospirae bacterium]|nr:glycosyltransferase family 4 protein [Nitrospirota bacterium]